MAINKPQNQITNSALNACSDIPRHTVQTSNQEYQYMFNLCVGLAFIRMVGAALHLRIGVSAAVILSVPNILQWASFIEVCGVLYGKK